MKTIDVRIPESLSTVIDSEWLSQLAHSCENSPVVVSYLGASLRPIGCSFLFDTEKKDAGAITNHVAAVAKEIRATGGVEILIP